MARWKRRGIDELLAGIAASVERRGGRPTYGQLAEDLGYASPAGARAAIMRLAAQGLISMDRGQLVVANGTSPAPAPSRTEVTRTLGDGPATSGEIARLLGAPESVVDGVLSRMEREGLVERCWRLRA